MAIKKNESGNTSEIDTGLRDAIKLLFYPLIISGLIISLAKIPGFLVLSAFLVLPLFTVYLIFIISPIYKKDYVIFFVKDEDIDINLFKKGALTLAVLTILSTVFFAYLTLQTGKLTSADLIRVQFIHSLLPGDFFWFLAAISYVIASYINPKTNSKKLFLLVGASMFLGLFLSMLVTFIS